MTLPVPNPVSEAITVAKVVFVVMVAIVIGYLAYTKSQLQTKLAQAQTDIVALTAANENWKTASDQSNAAIAAEVAAEKQRQEQATAAVVGAQTVAVQAGKDAAAIMAFKSPVDVVAGNTGSCVPDPQCVAAEKLMNSYFGVKK